MSAETPAPASSPDVQTIARWDSTCYGGDATAGEAFAMEINDQRETSGQLFVDVAPVSGMVDDMLGVGVEVAIDPMTLSEVPRVVINASEDLSLSIFQLGDQLLVVPGNGMPLKTVLLADGSFGYQMQTP